jgi:hypothetical protein
MSTLVDFKLLSIKLVQDQSNPWIGLYAWKRKTLNYVLSDSVNLTYF